MAKYKNREIKILKAIPHSQGDQLLIEHLEAPFLKEIVPKIDVLLTKKEKEINV